MNENMELAFDVQKIAIFMMMIIVNPLPEVAGLIIGNTTATICDGLTANITFAVDLQNGTIPTGSEIWYYESTTIATKPAGVFSPKGNYASRLHTYSAYGLALDNITAADGGRYFFVFSYRSPLPQGFQTATATLTVKVTPTDNCMPSYRQYGDLAICELDQTANCGSPRLEPMWTNTSANNFTVAKAGTYTCCANGTILMDCYRGSSSFCKTFEVAVTTSSTPAATTTTERKSSQTLQTTSLVAISTTDDNRTVKQQLPVIIGTSVGGSLFSVVIIVIVIYLIRRKNKRSRKERKNKKDGTELEQNNHDQAANSRDEVKEKERKNKKDGTELEQNNHDQAANSHDEVKEKERKNKKDGTELEQSNHDQAANCHAKVKDGTPKEEHEVTKSNPNKETSKPQMQSSIHSSYETSASHQDSKDKPVPKENEVGETNCVKPEIYNF